MKSLIRSFLMHLLILWITPQMFVGAFSIHGNISVLLTASLVFTLLHIALRPILSLLLLPMSLATFGVASLLVHVIVLYVLMIVIPEITISSWHFPGIAYNGIIVPANDLSFVPTLVSIAFFMALFRSIIEFLID